MVIMIMLDMFATLMFHTAATLLLHSCNPCPQPPHLRRQLLEQREQQHELIKRLERRLAQHVCILVYARLKIIRRGLCSLGALFRLQLSLRLAFDALGFGPLRNAELQPLDNAREFLGGCDVFGGSGSGIVVDAWRRRGGGVRMRDGESE